MSAVACRGLGGLAAAIMLACIAPHAARADRPASGDAPRVALVLFLSHEAPGRPAFDAAALHAGSWDLVTAIVRDLDRGPISRTEIEPIMRKWGVRTNLLVSDGFLKEVAAACGAEELLICDLMIYADRLLLCGRGVRTGTDRVVWADVEEALLPANLATARPSDLALWLEPIDAAGRRLLGRWRSRPEREDQSSGLVLLPVRTEGLEESAGRLVISCLLRSLLETHSGGIEDPGVTFSRLREAGIDPARLDRRSRPALAAGGAPGAVLVCDLVAYGLPPEFQGTSLPETEVSSGLPTPLPAAALSLRLVKADSGTVTYGATEYLEAPQTRGIFGMTKSLSLIKRVQPAADRLVHAAIQKG